VPGREVTLPALRQRSHGRSGAKGGQRFSFRADLCAQLALREIVFRPFHADNWRVATCAMAILAMHCHERGRSSPARAGCPWHGSHENFSSGFSISRRAAETQSFNGRSYAKGEQRFSFCANLCASSALREIIFCPFHADNWRVATCAMAISAMHCHEGGRSTPARARCPWHGSHERISRTVLVSRAEPQSRRVSTARAPPKANTGAVSVLISVAYRLCARFALFTCSRRQVGGGRDQRRWSSSSYISLAPRGSPDTSSYRPSAVWAKT
jgi:hypothetical protein